MKVEHKRICPNAPYDRYPAFTLAEAAVTAVVLAVLAAWLVPAAAGVSHRSKKGGCLDNLARISYANLVYAAQDPADMALPVHPLQFAQIQNVPTFIGAYEWGGKSGRGYAGFVPGPEGESAFLTSKYGTLAGFGPASRPLNDVVYAEEFEDNLHPDFDPDGAERDTQLELDVYRCPHDTGYGGVHFPEFRDEGYTSFDHFGTSYTANMFMTSTAGGGPITSNSPYLHRMSELLNPSTTLAFYENVGRFGWAAAPEQCDFIQPGLMGTARGWHGKDWTYNAAFIDGHVDSIYMRGYRNERVMLEAYVQEEYRCIIIRGDGWQKDTLPAERAYTGLNWGGGSGRPSYEHWRPE